jgi:hypothetical protein
MARGPSSTRYICLHGGVLLPYFIYISLSFVRTIGLILVAFNMAFGVYIYVSVGR